MLTRKEKKTALRNQIVDSAAIYSANLAGKTFLYIYGNDYFEVSFKTECFLHLTGVETALSARSFYSKAKNRTLGDGQFFFSKTHPYDTAKRKLDYLPRLPELTTTRVNILNDLKTPTLIYSVGMTNFEFTLGLAENTTATGKTIYTPRTFRIKDNPEKISAKCVPADYILCKDASNDKYKIVLVGKEGVGLTDLQKLFVEVFL